MDKHLTDTVCLQWSSKGLYCNMYTYMTACVVLKTGYLIHVHHVFFLDILLNYWSYVILDRDQINCCRYVCIFCLSSFLKKNVYTVFLVDSILNKSSFYFKGHQIKCFNYSTTPRTRHKTIHVSIVCVTMLFV